MINQLKKIFPSLINSQENTAEYSKAYSWFVTPENEIIGIKKTELDKKDHALLKLILTPYFGTHPPVTKRENAWFQLIFEQDLSAITNQPHDYRFILFKLSKPLPDPTDFNEAIDGLYSERPAIIWDDQQSGIIIEEGRSDDEHIISYEEIIEVFTTDFYLDLHLYIGPYLSDLSQAHTYYHWLQESYAKINTFSIKPIMNYVTAIPYLLTTLKEDANAQFLIDAILKDTGDDEELLHTIQVFLECNSNTTLAAKKLYMHRNSLQYRIDKFIEKTNINVKQFEEALSVYLILLLKNRLD